MTKSCYVFDLDGTLADITHRLHFIEGKPKDWRGFFAACGADTLIKPVAQLYNTLRYSSYRKYPKERPKVSTGEHMVIVSGRSDECREATEAWLYDNDIYPDALYMRAAGDHSPDYECKKHMLDRVLADGWQPVLFVDDRKQVVEMWRSLGYTCLQCAAGEF